MYFYFVWSQSDLQNISLYFVKMISQAERILKGTFKVKHFSENFLLHEQCASKLKLRRMFDVNMLTEFVLREQISVLQMWNPEILQLTVSLHVRKSPEHHQCILRVYSQTLVKRLCIKEMSNKQATKGMITALAKASGFPQPSKKRNTWFWLTKVLPVASSIYDLHHFYKVWFHG